MDDWPDEIEKALLSQYPEAVRTSSLCGLALSHAVPSQMPVGKPVTDDDLAEEQQLEALARACRVRLGWHPWPDRHTGPD